MLQMQEQIPVPEGVIHPEQYPQAWKCQTDIWLTVSLWQSVWSRSYPTQGLRVYHALQTLTATLGSKSPTKVPKVNFFAMPIE